ncbi:NAD-dependent DNA ligase LigA, partial [Candidatus Azambacteria bacterium]|nr:NAD-dependent DNA ligase LigA [Candidatus Azambacteria bacterium]
MTKQETKERIKKLREEIHHHRYLYHVLDRPEISDAALDSLKHELSKLEGLFPELVTPDSPTQRVGGRALEKFKKVRHAVPMLSLEDGFSKEEMAEWERRLKKLTSAPFEYFSELKIDGFAVSLVYEHGVLKVGATRGDGVTGEDVTQNLKTIEAIPLRLRQAEKEIENIIGKKLPAAIESYREIEVRGEVYMTKKAFEKVNREQEKKGLALYANPRNLAAGSVRQLDPKITASRELSFFAYDLVTDLGQEAHEEEHEICRALGFRTLKEVKRSKNLNEVQAFFASVKRVREKLPYEIDGIVVQVNENRVLERLGAVGKSPRGMIAYKFPGKEATTI